MILTLESKMPWGKYKGHKIIDIINSSYVGFEKPLTYLKWAIESWNNVEFDKEIEYVRYERSCNLFNLKHDTGPKQAGSPGDSNLHSCPGQEYGMSPSDYGIPYS